MATMLSRGATGVGGSSNCHHTHHHTFAPLAPKLATWVASTGDGSATETTTCPWSPHCSRIRFYLFYTEAAWTHFLKVFSKVESPKIYYKFWSDKVTELFILIFQVSCTNCHCNQSWGYRTRSSSAKNIWLTAGILDFSTMLINTNAEL